MGYDLLLAFGKSEADIRRYKDGKGVLKSPYDLLIKGLLAYHHAPTSQLTEKLEEMKQNAQVLKASPKIVCVSDGETLLAYDMREAETYENPLRRLYCDFNFFYPLAGVERFKVIEENPADIKAAEKLAKLHDELRVYNEFSTDDDLHDLNIFIARLLFCFFAEDTGIFAEQLFTGSIVNYTCADGSDLSDYLNEAFNIMDVRERTANTLSIIKHFPYVNGGLFSKHIRIPQMGRKARQLIIDCGELDWKNINPDIFGSMIQAVVNPEERATQGMHYTSVPNILKVINPLFMDDLRGEYEKLRTRLEDLKNQLDIGAISKEQFLTKGQPIHHDCAKLLHRMSKMKFFDPACGSGNFLIITYKMLRLLEMDILRLQRQIARQLDFIDSSHITLSQFYGIELLDFPHEVAMLSLWLAEHQMNKKLHENFGVNPQALPLKSITQIVCGNACRLDWNTVCPHTPEEEVFIFGNPPYWGSSLQEESHKEDLSIVFHNINGYKNLDYIAAWFLLGAKYIQNTKGAYAYVTTNSICQGEQVELLWERLLRLGIEIKFAYTSFKWRNNAKNNAGVTVNIIGLSNCTHETVKTLYTGEQTQRVTNINPYLIEASNIIIHKKNNPISKIPEMLFGSKAADGGFLILTHEEKEQILSDNPEADKFIKPYQGADSYINGSVRYCLWISDEDKDLAYSIPAIKRRIDNVHSFRSSSKKASTRKNAA